MRVEPPLHHSLSFYLYSYCFDPCLKTREASVMSRVGSLPGLGPDYTSQVCALPPFVRHPVKKIDQSLTPPQYFRGDVVVMRQGHEGKTWTVLVREPLQ